MRATEYLSDVAHNGVVNKTFEEEVTKIPVNVWWAGTMVSIGLSLTLKVMGRHRDAEFVGHWAPTFLGLGILSKLINHDQHTGNE